MDSTAYLLSRQGKPILSKHTHLKGNLAKWGVLYAEVRSCLCADKNRIFDIQFCAIITMKGGDYL